MDRTVELHASTLPHAMTGGLVAHGVPPVQARHVAHLPPVSILFAAFLGYNPLQHLLGSHTLAALSAHSQATITGRSFFPHLISAPFRSGLEEAFLFAIIACLVAAAASLLRGERYYAGDEPEARPAAAPRRLSLPSPQPEEQHAG